MTLLVLSDPLLSSIQYGLQLLDVACQIDAQCRKELVVDEYFGVLALDFAQDVLAPNGVFLGKVLRGGTENDLLALMKRDFRVVKHAKPPASRADSRESYVIATGFRGHTSE